MQDRHRELRTRGERQGHRGRSPDEVGHQVRLPVAGYGNYSYVFRLDA